jgi:hypothetical protein
MPDKNPMFEVYSLGKTHQESEASAILIFKVGHLVRDTVFKCSNSALDSPVNSLVGIRNFLPQRAAGAMGVDFPEVKLGAS